MNPLARVQLGQRQSTYKTAALHADKNSMLWASQIHPHEGFDLHQLVSMRRLNDLSRSSKFASDVGALVV